MADLDGARCPEMAVSINAQLEPEVNFQESNGVESSSLNLTLHVKETKHHQGMERATPDSIKPP